MYMLQEGFVRRNIPRKNVIGYTIFFSEKAEFSEQVPSWNSFSHSDDDDLGRSLLFFPLPFDF